MGQFVCKLYKKKELRILMQGLDAAGKTTILYQLKLGEVVNAIPTIGFNVETVQHKNINLTTWDIGGRDKIRPLYRHYYANTHAMMFIIDSNDKERLDQIANEINMALEEDELRNAVFLILANKQDLKSALSVEQVKQGINYDKIKAKCDSRPINIFGCSAVTEEGVGDIYKALDWLCEELAPSSSSFWSQSSRSVMNEKKEGEKKKEEGKKEEERKDSEKQDGTESKKTESWTFGSYVKKTFSSLQKTVTTLW